MIYGAKVHFIMIHKRNLIRKTTIGISYKLLKRKILTIDQGEEQTSNYVYQIR